MQAQSDFKLLSLAQVPVSVMSGDSVSVTLRAMVANAGDNQWPAGANLQFYFGDPAAGGVLIGETERSLTGCGRTSSVDFVWANVPPEAIGQRVYARLGGGSADAQLSTNILQINHLLFVPQVQRAN